MSYCCCYFDLNAQMTVLAGRYLQHTLAGVGVYEEGSQEQGQHLVRSRCKQIQLVIL